MLNKPTLVDRILLSPGVTALVSIVAIILMITHGGMWYVTALAAAAVGITFAIQIRRRAIFHGPNAPFCSIFMLFMAALMPGIPECALLMVAEVSLIAVFLNFAKPGATRTIFTLMLLNGIGALFFRPFAALALIIVGALIIVRAMNVHGVMAALLGLLTPLICYAPICRFDFSKLADVYAGPYLVMPEPRGKLTMTIALSTLACISAAMTFLMSYGYPAKARARNMTIYLLTFAPILFLIADYTNVIAYLTLVAFGATYHLSHLAASRRGGWIAAAIGWITGIVLYAI